MADAGPLTAPVGGAPAPEPGRVAAIRASLSGAAEACAAFAEAERAALASLNSHTLARARDGDLGECLVVLGHVRDRIGALDPSRLQPRRGFAGLFDSRGARLKAFRAVYASAASSAGDAAADLGGRGGAIAARDTALDNLWAETRDAITAIDAHIAAARSWLVDQSAVPSVPARNPESLNGPVEAQADAEAASAPALVEADTAGETGTAEAATTPEVTTDAGTGTETPAGGPQPEVAALPHPLETRLAALAAVRTVALARLPLLRAAQNADCRIPALVREVCEGIEAWRADWRDALGLAGRKPKKVHPDRDRLIRAQTALGEQLAAAERALTAAQQRRLELDGRSNPAEMPRKAA